MAVKTPALRELARGAQDNNKEKDGKRILSGRINSYEVFWEHQNISYSQVPFGASINEFKSH